MQLQTMTAHETAKFAGGNYILSGCTVNGATVSSGTVIINDEILPFVGGVLQSKIRIAEIKSSITAGSETYEDAYVRRHAEFGSNAGGIDTFTWNDIERLPTIKELVDNFATRQSVDEVRDMTMPKGGIIMWSGNTENLPAGFALCNGQTVNGVQTPDLRGRFIVGFDANKSNVPANATDLTENYGRVKNTGGRASVTLTDAQMPRHDHYLKGNMLTGSLHRLDNDDNDRVGWGYGNAGVVQTSYTDYAGNDNAHENRPPYYVLAFIIKTV